RLKVAAFLSTATKAQSVFQRRHLRHHLQSESPDGNSSQQLPRSCQLYLYLRFPTGSGKGSTTSVRKSISHSVAGLRVCSTGLRLSMWSLGRFSTYVLVWITR